MQVNILILLPVLNSIHLISHTVDDKYVYCELIHTWPHAYTTLGK